MARVAFCLVAAVPFWCRALRFTQVKDARCTTRTWATSPWARELPPKLVDALAARGIAKMTKVQELAWEPVISGLDAVVESPTATGKTLAYVLPLCLRLARNRSTHGGPRAIVVAPSRELAMQVGREVAKAGAVLGLKTATIFGGCPMARSLAALRSRPDVLVSTPGRLADAARRGLVDLDDLETFVLDEADALLDELDLPEVRALLFEEMDHDYQLVLFSATITDQVRGFAKGAMEVRHDQAFLDAMEHRSRIRHAAHAVDSSEWDSALCDLLRAARADATLVFVGTIAEAKRIEETLRRDLAAVLDATALHGDLAGAARTRAVASLRKASSRPRCLVCTDVASRGIDLPTVDLVVQLGPPRKAGKEGTIDADLYAHRAGRAGRDGRPVDCALLYDPARGEARLVRILAETYPSLGQSQPLPSPRRLLDASRNLALHAAREVPDDVARAFLRLADQESDPLLLGRALAALAGAPDLQPRALLSGRRLFATLRFTGPEPLPPSRITKICKSLGTGKINTVVHTSNTTALVDVPRTKLDTVLANLRDPDHRALLPSGLRVDLCDTET